MVDDIGEHMIPILFEGNETQFTTNGIGRLSDAITCIVTEKRNGAYELEMQYPIDGVHFKDIIHGRYILAKPAKYTQNQPFEIYKISKPVNGVCTICAYHISYRLSMIPVMPFSTNSITAALNGLKTNAAEQNPFNFSTTKTTVANYNQTEPRDARSCLGGVQGSILDVFGGGEYEFDMFNVKLWQNRGQNRGFEIRYGKNLIDLKQETNIENTITGIVPYYKNESETVTLPEKVIETESAANFPYPRSVPVDLSAEFQETVPTVAQLRAAGNAYIASHEIGVPKVSLTVSFVNLADVKGYEDIAVLEDVRLCDTVRVVFEKLGVDALAKVTSTEYDTLKEKFTKIELGDSSRITLANRIAAQEKATEEQTSALQAAIIRATNLITGVSGGYVVMHTGDDGKPYEILIMDKEDINQAVHVWRWNKNGWGYSSNGYNGTYRLAATIDGGIVADFITTGKLIGLEIDNGNGTFHVDSAGNLNASSATITGRIKARTGYIGTDAAGFEIDENNIHKGKISLTDANSGVYIGANGIALGPSSKFRVDSDGNLVCSNASIDGTINRVNTVDGVRIEGNVMEFFQGVCAIRNNYNQAGYGSDTTIAQTDVYEDQDGTYIYRTRLLEGFIDYDIEKISMNTYEPMLRITPPTKWGQAGELEFNSADRIFFDDNNGRGQPVHGIDGDHTYGIGIENGLPILWVDGRRLGQIVIQ